jgi:hypothetical protein
MKNEVMGMRRVFCLSIILILLSQANSIHAGSIHYNHNSIKIPDVIQKVDFNFFVPEKLPESSTLEIKTYPEWENDVFTSIRLHYMNKDDTHLLAGIEQSLLSENHHPYGEIIDLNGIDGYFTPYANSPGGTLTWVQEGTLIKMDSGRLTKNEMIEMASSMKVVK